MGIGAVFGAINTMYAIVAARTREIGTLRALGFSRRSILVSFLIESVILAVVGGAIGCLLAFPMNGFSTGTGQTQSFSEIAFNFRITPGDRPHRHGLRGGHGRARRAAARAARGAAAHHLGAAGGMTPSPLRLWPRGRGDLIRARLARLWHDRSSMADALSASRRSCGRSPAPTATRRGRSPSPPSRETRPLSSRESTPPAPPAAAVDPDDPAEPGIPDLARLARYVFKTMQRHEEICPFDNPFRDRLHFALADRGEGRADGARGPGARRPRAGAAGEARTLAQAQWPRELTAYVTCLAPHLQAVAMAPSPADGSYEPVYSFGGQAAGRPAP